VRTAARYDSYARWYDEQLTPFAQRATPLISAWLGPGPDRCLELGCGGGLHLPAVAEAGWFVVGVDISADQLAIARQRRHVGRLVQADVGAAPFADGSFDAVYAAFIHTDVDDWGAVAAQAARLVRPGGRVLYVGTHPCFVGPFSRYPGQAPPQLHPGYRLMDRTTLDQAWATVSAGGLACDTSRWPRCSTTCSGLGSDSNEWTSLAPRITRACSPSRPCANRRWRPSR